MLKAEFAALPEADAARIYQRVVDSGLWVPAAGDAPAADGTADDDDAEEVD